jgi:O-succinylbenzoic acid--CoA ligase
MEASAEATAAAVGLVPGMRALVCMSAQYVAGTMMLVRGLHVGMAMSLVEPDANPLLAMEDDFDFAALVPLQVQSILEATGERASANRARLDRARAILIGGGAISPSMEARIADTHAPTWHTYGMTETVSHIALRRLNGAQRSNAFQPLPGVEIALDARGCMRARGGMTQGEWVQTNDLVTLHEDGSFVWIGRIDNVINSGGIKVGVESLEQSMEPLLAAHFGSAPPRYFVAGLPDERLGQQITLFLECEPLSAEREYAILTHLRNAALPKYHAPRAIRTVLRFAQTPTGKIDRRRSVESSQ